MRQPIHVLGQAFASKSALKKFVKPRQPLSKPDYDFMMAILSRHRWAGEKIGCGVRTMWVQPNPPWNTRGFWLERTDGTKTDFSYLECIDAKPLLMDFVAACRAAVAAQVMAFKVSALAAGECRCPMTNVVLTLENSHVDHVAPKTFEWLVGEFVQHQGIEAEAVKINGFADGEVERRFVDESLCASWQEFHRANALLRRIEKRENLKMRRAPLEGQDDQN